MRISPFIWSSVTRIGRPDSLSAWPWPFWWMFTLENWFGLSAILWGGAALFGLLVVLPFVDRGPRRSWRRRPVVVTAAALVAGALVALTVLEALTTAEAHL